MKLDTIQSKVNKAHSFKKSCNFAGFEIVFLCAFILIIGLNVVASIYRGLELKQNLSYSAKDAVEFGLSEDFTSAIEELERVNESLSPIVGSAQGSGVSTQLKKIVDVSEGLAQCAVLAKGLQADFKSILKGEDENAYENFKSSAGETLDKLIDISKIYESIDFNALRVILPEVYMKKVVMLGELIEKLKSHIQFGREFVNALNIIMGDKYPHRILILLQNNDEVRPTGGFIGSLGFLDMNDGFIQNFSVKDVYEFDGQRVGNDVHPEISRIAGKSFGIRDANTSIDFAVSARQVKNFLEQAKGPGVDSVMAIDLDFVRAILSKVGPVYLPELDLTLSDQDFDTVLSYYVEAKLLGDKAPKGILKYFMDALLEAMKQKMDLKDMVQLVSEMTDEKHIFIYSDDEDLEGFVKELGISGNVKRFGLHDDVLSVVNISIGGNKSDKYMRQAVVHTTHVKVDGSLSDEVTIRRHHMWSDAVESYVVGLLKNAGIVHPSDDVLRILGKGDNEVMMRVYMPLGAKITSTDGINPESLKIYNEDFTVDTELGPKVVPLQYASFPFATESGKQHEVKIAYDLPFELKFDTAITPLDDYRLVLMKQAGVDYMDFEKRVYLQDPLKSYAVYPEFVDENGFIAYKAVVKKDKVLSVAIGS